MDPEDSDIIEPVIDGGDGDDLDEAGTDTGVDTELDNDLDESESGVDGDSNALDGDAVDGDVLDDEEEEEEVQNGTTEEIVVKLKKEHYYGTAVLSRYERTELISNRITQINEGSEVFVPVDDLTDATSMATRELEARKCPLKLLRTMRTETRGNTVYRYVEEWDPNEMIHK